MRIDIHSFNATYQLVISRKFSFTILFRKSHAVLKRYDAFAHEVFIIFLILYFVFTLHFSLEHGKTHTLHIPVVDNDDDKTKCDFSSYIEAGDFIFLVENLTSANIVEMNDKEVRNTLLI